MSKLKAAIWRNLLLIGALSAFAVVLFNSREELAETWDLLGTISLASVLILPALQLGSYFMISQYYRTLLDTFGGSVSRRKAFGITTALNFVNQILPSGGASGITYLLYAYKNAGNSAQLTLIQLGRYLLAFLTYVPLLFAAFIWLLISGGLNPQLDFALIVLIVISLPGTLLLIAAIRNQLLVDVLVAKLLGWINRIVMFVTRRSTPPIAISKSHGYLKDFHDGVQFIKSQRGKLLVPFLFMQLSTLLEVSIVVAAFGILGQDIHPAVILVAFTAANVAGAISVIPGDIGVHELAIITVLSYVGVDQSVAFGGTLLYRVFNKIIVMSIGFGFYVRLIKPLIDNANRTQTDKTANGKSD